VTSPLPKSFSMISITKPTCVKFALPTMPLKYCRILRKKILSPMTSRVIYTNKKTIKKLGDSMLASAKFRLEFSTTSSLRVRCGRRQICPYLAKVGYENNSPNIGLSSLDICLFVCLFHLYPPVTRKRRRYYILDESAPA